MKFLSDFTIFNIFIVIASVFALENISISNEKIHIKNATMPEKERRN